MKSKLLIYSILGILLSSALQSCDPLDSKTPSYRCYLIINNDLDYSVSLHMNFDAQTGGTIIEGVKRSILHPGIDSYLVYEKYLGKTDTPFEDIWSRFNKETMQCKFYWLDSESYEEGELIAEWGYDSPFFKESSWKLESYPGYHDEGQEYPLTVCRWTFSLSQIIKK